MMPAGSVPQFRRDVLHDGGNCVRSGGSRGFLKNPPAGPGPRISRCGGMTSSSRRRRRDPRAGWSAGPDPAVRHSPALDRSCRSVPVSPPARHEYARRIAAEQGQTVNRQDRATARRIPSGLPPGSIGTIMSLSRNGSGGRAFRAVRVRAAAGRDPRVGLAGPRAFWLASCRRPLLRSPDPPAKPRWTTGSRRARRHPSPAPCRSSRPCTGTGAP